MSNTSTRTSDRGAVVVPKLAVAFLDAPRIKFDIAGRGICDPGGEFCAKQLKLRHHRRKFLCDFDIAVIVFSYPVVETNCCKNSGTDARWGAGTELRYDRDSHLKRFPGADAAILRKRIERDVDAGELRKMHLAQSRA